MCGRTCAVPILKILAAHVPTHQKSRLERRSASASMMGKALPGTTAHAGRRSPRGHHESALAGGHRVEKARVAETLKFARGMRHRGAGASVRERGKGSGARTACGGRTQRRLGKAPAVAMVSGMAGHLAISRAGIEISDYVDEICISSSNCPPGRSVSASLNGC